MGDSQSDLWLTRRAADAAVGAFFGAGERQPRGKPDLEVAMAQARDPRVGNDTITPCVVALTDELAEVDEDTWGVLITQAARAFRSAEACLTARLGPGQAVEIDEKTWVPAGLPAPVLSVASCTTSLVMAWAMGPSDWCVLEVDQADQDRPIAVLLYHVAG